MRFSTVQMFNILEQMQKPKAPVVPMAVSLHFPLPCRAMVTQFQCRRRLTWSRNVGVQIRTCEYNMTEGGIPAANVMSLCSANSASYMSPVQSKSRRCLSKIRPGAANLVISCHDFESRSSECTCMLEQLTTRRCSAAMARSKMLFSGNMWVKTRSLVDLASIFIRKRGGQDSRANISL